MQVTWFSAGEIGAVASRLGRISAAGVEAGLLAVGPARPRGETQTVQGAEHVG